MGTADTQVHGLLLRPTAAASYILQPDIVYPSLRLFSMVQERQIVEAIASDLYVVTLNKLSLRGTVTVGFHGHHELVLGGYSQVGTGVRGCKHTGRVCAVRGAVCHAARCTGWARELSLSSDMPTQFSLERTISGGQVGCSDCRLSRQGTYRGRRLIALYQRGGRCVQVVEALEAGRPEDGTQPIEHRPKILLQQVVTRVELLEGDGVAVHVEGQVKLWPCWLWLVTVPPHGRGVDVDALTEQHKDKQ